MEVPYRGLVVAILIAIALPFFISGLAGAIEQPGSYAGDQEAYKQKLRAEQEAQKQRAQKALEETKTKARQSGDVSKEEFVTKFEESKGRVEGRQEAISEEAKQRIAAKQLELRQKIADKKQKLADRKLAQCEKSQARIKKLIENAVSKRQEQIAHINSNAEKVQDYYIKKGVEIDNYETLVETVNTKHAEAVEAVSTLPPAEEFDCKGEGPKAQIQEFHDKRALALDTLRDYRSAVKDLIKAVKAAKANNAEAAQ